MDNATPLTRHWEEVYTQKASEQMSWFQAEPTESLDRIDALGLAPSDSIIDVGGGHSLLVDGLLARGYADITVLDISAEALARAQQRLGVVAGRAQWLTADIRNWRPDRQYALWHDRAVLHFLTDPDDVAHYCEVVTGHVTHYVLISTFAPDGPAKCSGLDVRRYAEEDFAALLSPAFTLVQARRHIHVTPWGAEQRFLSGCWRRA